MNQQERPRCPKCGLYTDHVTGPRGLEACPYDRLRDALGAVEPTAAEDRQLHWLAGMDRPAIEAIESLFLRLRAGAPREGDRRAERPD
jgi:hypothetical protein